MPKYSIIIPVFNRPQEVDELLQSLTTQSVKDFEVLIIEDGSSDRCDKVVDRYRDRLSAHYFFKQNSGPGPSRNFGYAQATGEYFIVFDSDCIIPSEYLQSVEDVIVKTPVDAWGGPDRAHTMFTPRQRAMGYTMASILTTGGIRGSKKHVGWFQPRSFNMGISRKIFEVTGGFRFDRFAEDIEFSIRMKRSGFHVVLIPDAFVFHKRRTTFSQFFEQVSNFGKGRALIGKTYPQEVRITHWFPALFTVGLTLVPVIAVFSVSLSLAGLGAYILYFMAIFFHSWRTNDLQVAILSVPATLLQMTGYGLGFLKERLKSYKDSPVGQGK